MYSVIKEIKISDTCILMGDDLKRLTTILPFVFFSSL